MLVWFLQVSTWLCWGQGREMVPIKSFVPAESPDKPAFLADAMRLVKK